MIGITTFGDKRLSKTLVRFERQAQLIGAFDDIIINCEDELPDWYLWEHKDRLKRSVRGFGYWCWKPFVILQALTNNPNLDVLFYCDAGCHIRASGIDRMNDYIDALQVSNKDILAFQGSITGAYFDYDGRRLPDLTESHWTKGDLFHEFGINEGHSNAQTEQYGSGVIGLKNNSAVRDMLQVWIQNTGIKPHLFDDQVSEKPNFSGFRENRHDQSYFSLLAKEIGVETFSAFEYWYPKPTALSEDVFEAEADWRVLDRSPFFALRDRPISFLDRGRDMVAKMITVSMPQKKKAE